ANEGGMNMHFKVRTDADGMLGVEIDGCVTGIGGKTDIEIERENHEIVALSDEKGGHPIEGEASVDEGSLFDDDPSLRRNGLTHARAWAWIDRHDVMGAP